MSELIDRRAAIDAVDAIGHIATMPDGDKCIRRSAVKYTLSMLPPAQPEPTGINAKEAVYNLAEKIGIHQLFALTVELRGEPVQPEPQWIPCENDLPDIGMTVLFCDIDGDEFIGHRALHWWWSVDEKVKNVIAWMPLPKPFEGGIK